MSEMVERVERAICAALKAFDPQATIQEAATDDGGGEGALIDGIFDMRVAARAALEAMREPTPEMVEAGNDYFCQTQNCARTIFRDMIDAALSTTPPTAGFNI